MELGLVIYSTDTETVWNAFRLGVFSLKEGNKVKVLLLAKGVELINSMYQNKCNYSLIQVVKFLLAELVLK